jgi:hypothetical protein
MLAPEAAHEVLKGQRPARGVDGNGLALQHSLPGSQSLPDLTCHVGQAARNVGQVAGVDAHLVALAVDLYPGAVQLVLQRELPCP